MDMVLRNHYGKKANCIDSLHNYSRANHSRANHSLGWFVMGYLVLLTALLYLLKRKIWHRLDNPLG